MAQHTGSPVRELVLGEFQPDLEDALIDRLRRAREQECLAGPLILVPNRLLVRHLSLILTQRLGGWIGLEIMTLERVAARLAADPLAREGSCRLDRLGQDLLLRRILRDRLSEESYLRPLAESRGLAGALISTFDDLAESQITGDELADWSSNSEVPPSLGRKLRDLSRLRFAYQEECRRLRLRDSGALMDLAAVEAQSSSFLQRFTDLILYGFYDLNRLQRSLLSAAMVERDVTALFPYSDTPSFEFAEETLAWFGEEGFVERAVGARDTGTARRASGERRGESTRERALRNFLRDSVESQTVDASPAGEDDTLVVISAASPAEEIREALRLFVHRLRENDEAQTCAFLLRHAEEYRHLLAEEAELLGLPIALDHAAAGSDDMWARAASILLEIRRGLSTGEEGGRRRVIELATALENPLRLRNADCNPSEWELISLRLGIRGGEDWTSRINDRLAAVRSRLNDLGSTLPPEDEEEEARERQRLRRELVSTGSLRDFIERLRDALGEIPETAGWREIGRGLVRGLRRLVSTPESGGTLPAGDDPSIDPDSSSDSRLELALERLEELDSISGHTSLEEFAHFLSRALDEIGRYPLDPLVSSSLWGADLMSARGVPADYVVVPDLTEASFPRRPRQDPLLLDHEREIINRLLARNGDDRTLPLKLESLDEERLLFRLAVASARRGVILTTSRLEPARGRERTPSIFLLETYRAVTGELPTYEDLAAWNVLRRIPLSGRPHALPEEALEELEFDLALLTPEAEKGAAGDHGLASKVIERRPSLLVRYRAQWERWGSARLSNQSGFLSVPEIRALLEERHDPERGALSPSRLESYGYCPYKYFLQHLLGLEVLEEPERAVTLTPLHRGNLYHEILYRWFTRMHEGDLFPWDYRHLPSYLRLLSETLDECFRSFSGKYPVGPLLYWENEKSRVREDMERLLETELAESHDWLPTYFEIAFGRGTSATAAPKRDLTELFPEEVIVRLRGHPDEESEVTLSLRGRIDRVDLNEGGRGARIIDYKTGEGKLGTSDPLDKGRALQLPLYALAAQAFLPELHPELQVENASYYAVNQRKRFGRSTMARNSWMEREKELAGLIRNFLAGMSGGLFIHLPPKEYRGCESCDFLRVCGPGMPALAAGKRHDERSAFLWELREEGK